MTRMGTLLQRIEREEKFVRAYIRSAASAKRRFIAFPCGPGDPELRLGLQWHLLGKCHALRIASHQAGRLAQNIC
jgi:hypothetical protein